MNKRLNWLLIPSVALSFTACKKKEEIKNVEIPAAVVEPAKPSPVAPVEVKAPPMNVEKRAEKLGFAQHLPIETEAMMSFYNGSKITDRVKASKLWKMVLGQLGGGAMDLAETDEPVTGDEPFSGPASLFAMEFTLAMGASTGDQMADFLKLNQRSQYFQTRTAVMNFAEALKSEEEISWLDLLGGDYSPELLKELMNDSESGLALLDRVKIPPIYMAFKTREADRASAAQLVASTVDSLNMVAAEMIEPVEIEHAAGKFQGLKIRGVKVAEMLGEDRETMDEALGEEKTTEFLKIVEKKDLVLMTGTVGEYVVLFISGSETDFNLAQDANASLVATEALAFTDAYASKDLVAVTHGQKKFLETLIVAAGNLAEMTEGLQDGLASSELFSDTRDLDAMFKIVAEREAALRQLTQSESSGTVAYFESGLKIECYGGVDGNMANWKAQNRLAHLGDSENVLLFTNMTSNAAFDDKARAYYEALLETSYALTMKMAELPIKSEQLLQVQEMAKLFDTQFRPDLLGLWNGLSRDLGAGLGEESAVVIDLDGMAPPIPGIPQNVVDQVKIPRISFIAPVVDPKKLAASWEQINGSLVKALGKASEMIGQPIAMPKPLNSEKNGNTTWFFGMPFFTDDFLPSVTLGTQWFVASSSKSQAVDLIAKADVGGETRDGVWFKMNFKILESFFKQTYQAAEANAEGLMGAALGEKEKVMADGALGVFADLDSLTIHSRQESGVLRTSFHLKTR